MDLLFLLLSIFDGIIVGTIIAAISKWLFGNSPFARLIRLLLCLGGGFAYAAMCLNFGYSDVDITMGTFLFVVFAPIVLVVIALIVAYMFNNNENGNGGNDNEA